MAVACHSKARGSGVEERARMMETIALSFY